MTEKKQQCPECGCLDIWQEDCPSCDGFEGDSGCEECEGSGNHTGFYECSECGVVGDEDEFEATA